jgi:hypothetical protein
MLLSPRILVALQNHFAPQFPYCFKLVPAGDGDDPSTPATRQLDRGRAHAPRGTGHQNALSGGQPRPVQHVLRSAIGAWNGGKFDVAPGAVDGKNLGGRNLHELGESAIEIGRHPDSLQAAKSVGPHAGADQHAPADQMGVASVMDTVHQAAAVGPLNKREWRRLVPAAIDLGTRLVPLGSRCHFGAGGDARRVPSETRVDLGVIHSSCKYLDQHFSRSWRGNRNIPVDKLVIAAVSGCHDSLHRPRAARDVEPVCHPFNPRPAASRVQAA